MAAKTTVRVSLTNSAAKDDVFTGDAYSWLMEDGALTGSLNVLGNDPGSATLYAVYGSEPTGGQMAANASDTFSVDYFGTTYAGTLTKNANGTVGFDLSSMAGLMDSLAEGENFDITFYYTAKMANGVLSTAKVSIAIVGENDAPTISATSTLIGTVHEDGVLTAGGTVVGEDVDHGAVLGYTVDDTAGDYGTFALNAATGVWSYVLDNAAHQNLAEGETHVETFAVTVTDEHGATATQNVLVTVIGTNDAPEITSNAQTGALGEDDAAPATGQVTSTDKDNGATATYTGNSAGTYGNFTVNSSTGEWAYTLTAAAQGLQAGQTVTETFTVTVTDDFGATATQDVDVTITGAADGAAIVNDPAATQETAATEAGGVANGTAGDPSASGKLLVTDLDTGDAKFQVPASLAGTYGTFTFDADTGAWTYALDDAAANVQALTQGQAVTDSLVVTSLDGSASHTIAVNITGTNDVPTVTGTDTGSVTEDMSFTATGTLVATDVDAGQSQFQAQTDIAGTYGKLSVTSAGVWTYTLTNSAAAVQALNSGQSVIDTITVLTADGTSKVIDITVNGQNELSGGLIDAVGAITSEMELFLNFRDANSDGVQDGFVNRVGLDPSANSNEVTWGDFNGDGKIDFVNASFADGNVYYFRNLGDANNDGVPEFAKSAIAVGPEGGWTLLAKDMDGDGDLDLVVGGGYTGLDRVLVNTGDANNNGVPEFTGVALTGSTGYSYGMAAGDVNGDGINDVVSTNFGYGPLQVFYGRGDTNNDGLPEFSTAQTPPRPVGADISVAIADMDGDGDNDLVVTQWGGKRYIDYNVGDTNNDGNPDFVNKLLGNGSFSSFDIKSVDLDGDGDLDLVSTDTGGALTLFLNQGDTNADSFPDFTLQSISITGTYSVDVGDWDHDGDADLIVSSQSGLHLIENLGVAGNGTILTATSFVATTQNGWSMDVAFVPDLLI